jgi:hypothetical protein
MRKFNVTGYLIGVDKNRLTIRVDDDDIERIAFIKTFHKKSNQLGNFITVNARSAKYNITNLDWKEITDLIGVRLQINCETIISDFKKKIIVPNTIDSKFTYIPEYIHTSIVSFSAKIIKNV